MIKVEKLVYTENDKWDKEFPVDMDSPQTLILAFGATEFFENCEAIEELREMFPHSKLLGCSAAGGIIDSTIHENSFVVSIVRFEKTRLKTVTSPVSEASDSFEAGEAIGRELSEMDLRGVLILSDGLRVNGSSLVEGINSVLPSSVAVTGGLASDGERFENTWVLRNAETISGYVSAVGFYGDSVVIDHGSRDGLDIFGIERKVTKSTNNQLFELDNQPALDLYKSYLGERASELPASALHFPLSLRVNGDDEKRVVRTILNVDEETKSLIFAGDVPQGALAQLMRANLDRLIDGAGNAASMSRSKVSNEPVLSIAISCVGRRWILGERTEEELDAVMNQLPEDSHQIGFYSYGEIAPHEKGFCDLHNQTMTLTTIFEY